MNGESQQDGWQLWLRWTLATMAGWSAGLTILFLTSGLISSAPLEAGSLVISGLLIAIFQWLVLRGQLPQAGHWVLVSTLGWVGGLILSVAQIALGSIFTDFGLWIIELNLGGTTTMLRISFGLLVGIMVGGMTGFSQWLVIRRQQARVGWWILASISGWFVPFLTLILLAEAGSAAFLGGGVLAGAIAGAITGAALLPILHPQFTSFLGLRARMTATFSLLVILSILGASYWVYEYVMGRTIDNVTQEMETLLRVAKAGMDGNKLSALHGEGQPQSSPRYQEQRDWLETVRGEDPYVLFVLLPDPASKELTLTMVTRRGDDAEPAQIDGAWTSQEGALAWQELDHTMMINRGASLASPDLFAELLWQNPTHAGTASGPQSEGQVIWPTGYTPLENEQGERFGVLGVQLDPVRAAEIQVGIFQVIRRMLAEVAIPMLLAIFLISRAITGPLIRVTEAARQIARGEYRQDLSQIHQVRFRSEISELAEAIEESGRVHISERRLRQEVSQLRIKIDEARRREQVETIVEDDFFQDLRSRAAQLRAERRGEEEAEDSK